MKTITTQHHSPARTVSWKLLPALLVAFFSLCAFPSNGQTWTVGTGTSQYSSTGNPPAPLGYYYPSGRMQYIYDTAFLRAAGMPVGGGNLTINQIAFNVGALNASLPAPALSIGIDNTTLTTLPTTSLVGSIPTRASSTNGIGAALGWNNINLNVSSFTWDGTSNIIIDICYATGNSATGNNAGVLYHTATGKSTYAYTTTGANFCGIGLAATATSNRPNIQFTKLFPCLGPGRPSAGTLSPSGTVSTLCPGSVVTLAASGYTNALGITFKWMTSTTATGPWVPVGTNSDRYTTPPLVGTSYYHLTVTCTNTGLSDSTANTSFTFPGGFPVYGALPYFESFENWGNGCAIKDKISSNNWTNAPATGDNSWRREDEATGGNSASWNCPTCYATANPPAVDGLHSARWHGYKPTAGLASQGTLQLYVNTSATAGNKDLEFYYRFNYGSTSPNDSLNVDTSTDGGATFGPLAKIGPATGPVTTWNYVLVPNIPVSSPTTVFRFRATQGSTYWDDIYLDAVRITPPCAGKPTAGKIDTIIACKGATFKLKLKGNSMAAGLTYLWQFRPAGTTAWSPLPGGNVASPSTIMNAATDYRVIVTCTNGLPMLSDTTAIYHATLAPFYFCYCGVTVSSSYLTTLTILVGNVTVKNASNGVVLLNNGNPLPTVGNLTTNGAMYEDFRLTVPAPTLVRDSTYNISVAQTAAYTSWYPYGYGCAWIDFNRNGVFDNPSERILYKAITNQANPTANANFTVPTNAAVGLTGMRVMDSYFNVAVLPCGQQYAYGQAEDYLVYIEYQPCSGPVNPGVASASDTAVCPGYTIDLYDTSYEKLHTGILRMWEVSTNGGASFSAIPGSGQKDTMANVTVTATSKYRLRVICGPTGDTTYSNVLSVSSPVPVRCYPVSWAGPGGDSDSSDIGAFIIGNFVNPAPSVPAGPHLLNPLAHRRRTDFTLLPPIELYADSTYRLAVFHTMPRGIHADAMVSVYIDYNNDLKYDQYVVGRAYTSEMLFQGVTRIDSFFLDTKVTIPDAVIPNVPTGLRVVLNNDLSNISGTGNRGDGVFTSGEVEDYIVIFRKAGLSAGSATLLQNLALYPNPTEGKFTVLSDAARAVSHMDVVVSTITGQHVINRSFDNVGTHFSTELDLSTQAKGIYFVEIRADGEKITKKLIVR